MRQERRTGMAVGFIVGLLMLGGCGSDSSQTGGTGQVLLEAPAGVIGAAAGSTECTTRDSSATLVISAALDIVGWRTGMPMTVNPDCSVTATVPNVPVGTWVFRITYYAGSGDDRLVIAEASGVGTVAANTTTPVPLALTKLSGPATAVAAGFQHSCARLADETVSCWGNNSSGQLGDGATRLSERRPVLLEDFPNVAAVSVGELHSCARLTTNLRTLEATGTVWCWGANDHGQLGGGGLGGPFPTPQPIVDPNNSLVALTGLTDVAVGSQHSCAIMNGGPEGTVWCWGRNQSGQVGKLQGNFPYVSPQKVLLNDSGTGLTGVTAIAAGGQHSCAVLKDGTVWCWGANQFGQLGRGSTEGSSFTPQPVLKSNNPTDVLTGVAAIATGTDYSCAVVDTRDPNTNGTVWCWGNNRLGQLGKGDTGDTFPIPQPVFKASTTPLTNVTAIVTSSGRSVGPSGDEFVHSCAVLKDGTVWCWGDNKSGQLGNGQKVDTPSPFPQQVLKEDRTPLTNVTAIAAGWMHSCAVLKDGTVWCWGANELGQLGNGSRAESPLAVKVVAIP